MLSQVPTTLSDKGSSLLRLLLFLCASSFLFNVFYLGNPFRTGVYLLGSSIGCVEPLHSLSLLHSSPIPTSHPLGLLLRRNAVYLVYNKALASVTASEDLFSVRPWKITFMASARR